MSAAVVKLTPFLSDQTFFGQPIPDWWVQVCASVGLEATLVMDDTESVGCIRIDGRFLALDAADLSDLDEHDGVLCTSPPDEVVVAAGPSSRSRLGRRAKGRQRLVTTDDLMPVHDLDSLSAAEGAARWRTLDQARSRGVRVLDPSRVIVAPGVIIEPGAILWPDVVLLGATRVGPGASIGAGAHLTDTRVGRNAQIKPYTVAEGAMIGEGAQVGPFAHLRPGTVVEARARIGNFVETKNAQIGEGAKANHLSYLGDCSVGAGANVGAGTVTCNFDGARKHHTIIGAGAFIGTNSALVAPVRIGEGALIAAGSVITRDVEPGALAVSRSDQHNVPDKGEVILTRNRLAKAAEPPPPVPEKPKLLALHPVRRPGPPLPPYEYTMEESYAGLNASPDPEVPITSDLPAFAPEIAEEVLEEEAG